MGTCTGWGAYGTCILTGNAISANLASVTIDNEINTGWGSDGWGVEGWGESIQTVTPSGQSNDCSCRRFCRYRI